MEKFEFPEVARTYSHYKGGYYTIALIGQSHEDFSLEAVYVRRHIHQHALEVASMTAGISKELVQAAVTEYLKTVSGSCFVRPANNFASNVPMHDGWHPRFLLIED